MQDRPPAQPPSAPHSRAEPPPPPPPPTEVRAGPGDAGMADRPMVNARPAARKPLSNRRLAIGLGIAAGLALVSLILRLVF